MDGKSAFLMLARKLRAKARWDYIDGYYTDADGMARNAAKREFAEDLATLIDEAFDLNSTEGMPSSREYNYKTNKHNTDVWAESVEEQIAAIMAQKDGR